MIFKYEDNGKVKVNMSSYVKNMLEDFPVKLKKSQTAATPADNLGQGRKLNKEDAEAFHTMVAKDYLYANEQDPTFSLQSRCCAREQKNRTCQIGTNSSG